MKILLDVDGFVADFVGGYLKEVKAVTGRVRSHEDITNWPISRCESLGFSKEELDEVERRVNAPGWASQLEMLPGAEDLVCNLERRHEIVFVTAPNWRSPTWCWDRTEWLHIRFPGTDIVHTRSKHHVDGDVLVDDTPHHVVLFQRLGLLWDQPWNRYGLCPVGRPRRICSPDELLELVGS